MIQWSLYGPSDSFSEAFWPWEEPRGCRALCSSLTQDLTPAYLKETILRGHCAESLSDRHRDPHESYYLCPFQMQRWKQALPEPLASLLRSWTSTGRTVVLPAWVTLPDLWDPCTSDSG